MTTHVKVIAALFLVLGAVLLLLTLGSTLFFGALAGFVGAQDQEDAELGMAVLGLVGAALTIALLAYAIPALVCGWGLLKYRSWARILAIVLGAIALVEVPIGTLFGVYVLVILFNKKTEALFETGGRALTPGSSAPAPPQL